MFSRTKLLRSFSVFALLVSVSLSSLVALSSEEKKKEPEGEKKEEAKAEPKAEGWAEVVARVQGLKAKVDNHEKTIKGLVEQKSLLKEGPQLNEVIRQLVAAHKAYLIDLKEYDKERAYLMYRFPERGVKNQRNYERVEAKTLEEMESSMSLEGRVGNAMKKMRKQFPQDEAAKENAAQKDLKDPYKDSGNKNLLEPVIFSK